MLSTAANNSKCFLGEGVDDDGSGLVKMIFTEQIELENVVRGTGVDLFIDERTIEIQGCVLCECAPDDVVSYHAVIALYEVKQLFGALPPGLKMHTTILFAGYHQSRKCADNFVSYSGSVDQFENPVLSEVGLVGHGCQDRWWSLNMIFLPEIEATSGAVDHEHGLGRQGSKWSVLIRNLHKTIRDVSISSWK